ncbi:MAG: hypothetical protein E6R08_06485 [Nevskiaceae bacterium]|nr:MAG: hypothetical protein E6R08_06485 [Nevskiaceae bacterium]
MLQTLSTIAAVVIVLLTTWSVLTIKIKTNSAEILALALINMGGVVTILESLDIKPRGPVASTFIIVGFALLGVVWFVRVEVYPYLFKRLSHETSTGSQDLYGRKYHRRSSDQR